VAVVINKSGEGCIFYRRVLCDFTYLTALDVNLFQILIYNTKLIALQVSHWAESKTILPYISLSIYHIEKVSNKSFKS